MRWRAATREERQIAWLWGIVAVSSILLRPFWLAVAPFLPRCPLRALTGVPCPTCGSTRAALALMEGHPGEALTANPLVTVTAIVFLAGGLLAPLWVTLKGPLPELPRPLPGWLRILVVLVILAGWAFVIATSPPAWSRA